LILYGIEQEKESANKLLSTQTILFKKCWCCGMFRLLSD